MFYIRFCKRVLDVILCSFALIVLSPLFLITAVGIKLSSRGPIFYYSDRAGINGKPFHFYKFRSMHQPNGNQKDLFIADEDRLFRVGRIIRRLKIDELPQLINVIRGDMSIVGPRPMPTSSVDRIYYGQYRKILNVKPGLTSAASLYDYIIGDTYQDDEAYRKEVLPIKLKMEMLYVNKRSLKYDAQLVIRTMTTIIRVLLGVKDFPQMPELIEID